MSFKTSCPSHIFRELPSTSHPQQNRLGSLATSGNLQVPSGTQKWDFFLGPNFSGWMIGKKFKKKMCIFCPISFNKFKMWGLKTWVSPRKTCRKGRLRVLVGIMSRRRTEKLVVPAGKKKNESREVATSYNLCFERLELLPCLHSRFVMKSKLQSTNSCWKCGEMSWILS